MKENKDIMKEEIRLRMENDSWDFSIAHKVIEIRNAKKEKTMNIWSLASLATAAMAFIVFMASIYAVTSGSDYSSGSIYSYAYIKDGNNLDNDMIGAKLELTINEAYPMR